MFPSHLQPHNRANGQNNWNQIWSSHSSQDQTATSLSPLSGWSGGHLHWWNRASSAAASAFEDLPFLPLDDTLVALPRPNWHLASNPFRGKSMFNPGPKINPICCWQHVDSSLQQLVLHTSCCKLKDGLIGSRRMKANVDPVIQFNHQIKHHLIKRRIEWQHHKCFSMNTHRKILFLNENESFNIIKCFTPTACAPSQNFPHSNWSGGRDRSDASAMTRDWHRRSSFPSGSPSQKPTGRFPPCPEQKWLHWKSNVPITSSFKDHQRKIV